VTGMGSMDMREFDAIVAKYDLNEGSPPRES
jgi:hypothetical protein